MGVQWEARALMVSMSAMQHGVPQSSVSERRVASPGAQSGTLAPRPITFAWQAGGPYEEPKASWPRLSDVECPNQ